MSDLLKLDKSQQRKLCTMHHFPQPISRTQQDRQYKHLHQYYLWLQPLQTYQQHINESKLSKLQIRLLVHSECHTCQQRKLCTDSQVLSLSRFQQRMVCRYFRIDIAL